MKTNRPNLSIALGTVMAAATFITLQLPAPAATAKPSHGSNTASAAQWSVQVDKVNPGEVALSSSFQIAIYESLLN